MLIYHDDEKSPNCFKTKILLYELDVPFEQMNHDFLQGDLKTDTFMGKFPNSKVPALEDGPVHISESGAIALYLADKYGKLMPPALPQRALMYQALNLESAHLAPTLGGYGYFGQLFKPEKERNRPHMEACALEAKRLATMLSALLADGQAYFAQEYSIADIQLYPVIVKGLQHHVFESPELTQWARLIAERPAVAKARQEYPGYAGE